MQGARAQRIEMLLLHEFHARKFILPDKLSQRDKAQLAAQKGGKGKKGSKIKAESKGTADAEDVSVQCSKYSNIGHCAVAVVNWLLPRGMIQGKVR